MKAALLPVSTQHGEGIPEKGADRKQLLDGCDTGPQRQPLSLPGLIDLSSMCHALSLEC